MKLSKFKVSEFGVEPPPTIKDRISCYLGYHCVVVEKQLSHGCQKIRCIKCQKEYAINHRVHIVIPWDRDVEIFYQEFGSFLNP